jgi:hypothetical protein
MKLYSAGTYSTWAIGAVANPVSIFTLVNPTTSKVFTRLHRISFSLVATAATSLAVGLVKNSSIPTGGTSTTLTPQALNPNDPTATSTCNIYTAVPTGITGTSIVIRQTYANVPTSATGGSVVNSNIVWDDLANGEGILLVPGNSIMLQISSTTSAGTAALMDLDFSEE